MNVRRVDAAAGVKRKFRFERLAPGDDLDDQELPKAGNRLDGGLRDVGRVVYSLSGEHSFAAVFDMGNVG